MASRTYRRGVTKEVYENFILLFTPRRAMLKRKYGRSCPEAKKLTARLRNWRRAINRIKSRETKFKNLTEAFEDYFAEKTITAKRMFCKYALEAGFHAPIIAKYIGYCQWYVWMSRVKFNKTGNREDYGNFKRYIDRAVYQED